MNKNLKLPKSGASPGVFFARQDKTIVHGVFKKKKDVADKCILEAITTTSFGTGRGVSVKKKIEASPNWRKPWRFFCQTRQKHCSWGVSKEKRLGGQEYLRGDHNKTFWDR